MVRHAKRFCELTRIVQKQTCQNDIGWAGLLPPRRRLHHIRRLQTCHLLHHRQHSCSQQLFLSTSLKLLQLPTTMMMKVEAEPGRPQPAAALVGARQPSSCATPTPKAQEPLLLHHYYSVSVWASPARSVAGENGAQQYRARAGTRSERAPEKYDQDGTAIDHRSDSQAWTM